MNLRSILFRVVIYLGILLLLVSILIPTVGTRLNSTRITSSQSNLAQIAKTYASYSNGSTIPRNLQLPPGSTAHDAAFVLAQKADLNDASVWFINADDRLFGVHLPKSVIEGDIAAATGPSPAFARVPLSVVIVANLSTSSPSTTTPVAWTRGLREDGTWAPDSPWKGKGGHIAYLDGHVEWQDKLDARDPQASFVVAPGWPNPGTATANITMALSPGAIILSAEPRPAAH